MPEATKVFISYSHDSQEHMDRVLALSDRLRREGIDCRIDQDEQSPPEGWPQWCGRQVEQSGFVLVACTQTYLRRFKGEEEAGYNAQDKTVPSPKRTLRTSLSFFRVLRITSSVAPRATSCFIAVSPISR